MALRGWPVWRLALGGLGMLIACADSDPGSPAAVSCTPSSTTSCSCSDGGIGARVCGQGGSYGACTCGASTEDHDAEAASDAGGEAQSDAEARSDAEAPTTPASDAGTRGDGGSSEPEPPADSLEALRQLCVDTINMHRATMGLPPLSRAPASEESCSDEGAKLDHETKRAHGSAARGALACRSYAVAQNTCPDYRYGGFYGTPADGMVRCLQQMWDEGEPPGGIDQCIADYFAGNTACFLAHGHYINMVSTTSRTVSCGFHDSGAAMWMNQDFR